MSSFTTVHSLNYNKLKWFCLHYWSEWMKSDCNTQIKKLVNLKQDTHQWCRWYHSYDVYGAWNRCPICTWTPDECLHRQLPFAWYPAKKFVEYSSGSWLDSCVLPYKVKWQQSTAVSMEQRDQQCSMGTGNTWRSGAVTPLTYLAWALWRHLPHRIQLHWISRAPILDWDTTWFYGFTSLLTYSKQKDYMTKFAQHQYRSN